MTTNKRLEIGDRLVGMHGWGCKECTIVSVTDTEAIGEKRYRHSDSVDTYTFNRDFTEGDADGIYRDPAVLNSQMDGDTQWFFDIRSHDRHQ